MQEPTDTGETYWGQSQYSRQLLYEVGRLVAGILADHERRCHGGTAPPRRLKLLQEVEDARPDAG